MTKKQSLYGGSKKTRKRTKLKGVKPENQFFLGGLLGKRPRTSSAYWSLPDHMRGTVDQYLNTARTLATQPFKRFEGQRVAQLTGLENMATEAARANFGRAGDTLNEVTDINRNITNRFMQGPTLQNLQSFMSPFQQAVIDQTKRETARDFEGQLQDIGRSAARSGAFGGSRQALMESEAFRNFNRNLADIQERGSQAGFENAQEQFFRSLQGAGSAADATARAALSGQQAVAGDVGLLSGRGALERSIQQAGMDVDYADYLSELNFPIQQLNVLGGALGNVSPYFAPTQTGGPSPFGQLLGTAIGAAAMKSDERVKENSEVVGKLDNGLPVYKYNYKGSPKTQIGVMAQDVEKVKPEAVIEGPGGVKMVNYNQATEKTKKKFAAGGSVSAAPNWLERLRDLVFKESPDATKQKKDEKDSKTSKKTNTQVLAKALNRAAEDTLNREAIAARSLDQASQNIANARFNPLIPVYLQEQTLANDLVRQSHQNLFKCGGMIKRKGYQEGGYVDRSGNQRTPGPNIFRRLASMGGRGLEDLDTLIGERTGLPPSVAMNEFSRAGRDVKDFILGFDPVEYEQRAQFREKVQQERQAAQAAQTPKKSPTQTQDSVREILGEAGMPIPKVTKEQLGSDVLGPEDVAPPQPPRQKMTAGIKDILSELGLGDLSVPEQPESNPLLDFAAVLAAYGGSGPVGLQRALAAGFESNQSNIDRTMQMDEQNLARKLKALEVASTIQRLENSQSWEDLQRLFLVSKAGGRGGSNSELKDLKTKADIEKAALDIQKKQLELQQLKDLAGGPTENTGGLRFDVQTGKVVAK